MSIGTTIRNADRHITREPRLRAFTSFRSIYNVRNTRPPSQQKRYNSTSPPPPHSPPPHRSNLLAPSSRLAQSYPRLVQLSTRTGVPLPSLAISFLILHEITAVVPVILLFWVFQSIGLGVGLLAWIKGTAGVQEEIVGEGGGHGSVGNAAADDADDVGDVGDVGGWRGMIRDWYEEAEGKVERVGKRYGILGYDKAIKSSKGDIDSTVISSAPVAKPASETETRAGTTEPAAKVVKTVARSTAAESVANAISAYIVVKALLPVRIATSVGLAPAFARFALNPIHRTYRRFRPSKTG